MLGTLNANSVVFLGLLLAAMWLLQFALAYRQMRGFYHRLKMLRKGGLTAVGRNGNRVHGRVYAVLVADAGGRVVSAEAMNGYTVFARLRPFPSLVGMALADLQTNESTLPIPARLRPAFAHAARSLAEGQPSNAAIAVGDARPGEC